MMHAIWLSAVSLGSVVWHFANSNFAISILGTFAAAFAGAYGAQWIAERSERRRRALEEIRATNAAILMSVAIVETYCALKKQHVRRLKEEFERQRNELRELEASKQRGAIPAGLPFSFQADLATLPPPKSPVEVLQKLLFEKISVSGRALTSITTIAQCVDGLDTALERRNDLIESWTRNPPANATLAALYFGLADTAGRTDLTYPNCVAAIYCLTDDCIFYSKTLAQDLVRHGRHLVQTFGNRAPAIHEPDFSKATELNLMPDDAQYQDYLQMFKAPVRAATAMSYPWVRGLLVRFRHKTPAHR